MPTVVVAQSKGGAGKTTLVTNFAGELARNGATVTIVDADPNQHAFGWANKDGCPESLTAVTSTGEDTLIDTIEAAQDKSTFVIVDLEGTASLAVGLAISRADLVLIPAQGSQDDVDEAIKTIKLIRQSEKGYNVKINYAVVFTRTPAAIQSKNLKSFISQFDKAGIPVFKNRFIEREAYKVMKSYGGCVNDLSPTEVGGAKKAADDVRALTKELAARLKAIQEEYDAQRQGRASA